MEQEDTVTTDYINLMCFVNLHYVFVYGFIALEQDGNNLSDKLLRIIFG